MEPPHAEAERALAELQATLSRGGSAARWRDPSRPAVVAPRAPVATVVPLEKRIKLEPGLLEPPTTSAKPLPAPTQSRTKPKCPECMCTSKHNSACSIGLAHGLWNFKRLSEIVREDDAEDEEDDDLGDLDDDEEVLQAVGRAQSEGVRDVARAPPKRERSKECKSCSARCAYNATACGACGGRFVSRKGCFKEQRRLPCAGCDAAIAAKHERCDTCGSVVEFRARERKARARLQEQKRARRPGKRKRALAAAAEVDEQDAQEQERLLAAAAQRHSSSQRGPPCPGPL